MLFLFGQHLLRDIDPLVTKIRLWASLGCRSGLDAGPFEKDFLAMLKPKKREIFTSVRVRHRNRSGVVDLVDRDPLMFARVENGVTKSFQFFRRKNRKAQFWPEIFPFLSRIACCSRESTSV
jgi:hypothetical protein